MQLKRWWGLFAVLAIKLSESFQVGKRLILKRVDDLFADSFRIDIGVVGLRVEGAEHPPPCSVFHAIGCQSDFPVQVTQFMFEFVEQRDSLIAVQQACLMVRHSRVLFHVELEVE